MLCESHPRLPSFRREVKVTLQLALPRDLGKGKGKGTGGNQYRVKIRRGSDSPSLRRSPAKPASHIMPTVRNSTVTVDGISLTGHSVMKQSEV